MRLPAELMLNTSHFQFLQANGYFEVLVPPSRNNANAVKSASAIMGGMWCLTANDHGSPGSPSPVAPLRDYRAITACFEALPGRIIPVDLAPVMITAPIVDYNGNIVDAPCGLPLGKPELFTVHSANGVPDMGPICETFPCELEIRGRNFCTMNGTDPTVTLEHPTGSVLTATVLSCTVVQEVYNSVSHCPLLFFSRFLLDHVQLNVVFLNLILHQVIIEIGNSTGLYGMFQLELVNADNEELLNGISVHLLGGSYKPKIYNVMDTEYAPTPQQGRIQQAIDFSETGRTEALDVGAIILIPPNVISDNNLEAAHVENLIMGRPAKLQGFGTCSSLPA